MRSQILVVLALSLAGCSGGGGAPSAGDPAPDDPGDGDGRPSPEGEGVAQVPGPQSFPIAWDGAFGRDACIPSGPDSCSGAPGVTTDGETDLILDAPGSTRWEIDVVLTWETMNPAMADLVLKVYAMESCGDGCMAGSRDGDPPTGPSPLTAAETLVLQGNQTGLWFRVDVPRQTPSPVYAEVTEETPFRLEGTATAYFD